MNEDIKKIIKRSLAAVLALILVIGTGGWMRDARLKADEEAPAEAVVEEAPVEAVIVEAPAEESAVVVQEVSLPAEEPAPEPTAEPAPEPTAEPAPEDPLEEVIEEKAPFDLFAAYEHYMSLGSDGEKAAYLDSLDPADRAELERYIAENEAVMAAAVEEAEAEAEAEEEPKTEEPGAEGTGDSEQVAEGTEVTEDPEEEAEEEKAEEEPAEEPEEEKTEEEPSEEPVEEKTEEPAEEEKAPFDALAAYEHYASLASDDEKATYLDSLDPADRAELEKYIAEEEAEAEKTDEPEEEPEEEMLPGTFASAMISGEWAGRDTSTLRSLTVEVYVDGERADACSSEANRSVANFSVAIGEYTVLSESSGCGGFSGSSGTYSVDMYADTSATVTIMLESPEVEGTDDGEQEAAEEEPAEKAEEFDPAKAYEAYKAMTEEEREAFIATLTAEEYEAILKLEAEEKEKAEPVELEVKIWCECPEGKVKVGRTLIWKSEVTNATEDMTLHYQWQYDRGNGWEDIPGATDPEYSLIISRENAKYQWRLNVNTD